MFYSTLLMVPENSNKPKISKKKLKELLGEPREPSEVLAPLKTRRSPNTARLAAIIALAGAIGGVEGAIPVNCTIREPHGI